MGTTDSAHVSHSEHVIFFLHIPFLFQSHLYLSRILDNVFSFDAVISLRYVPKEGHTDEGCRTQEFENNKILTTNIWSLTFLISDFTRFHPFFPHGDHHLPSSCATEDQDSSHISIFHHPSAQHPILVSFQIAHYHLS